jgi:hypothetical protein
VSSFYFLIVYFFSGIGIFNYFFIESLWFIFFTVLLLLHVSFEKEFIFENDFGLLFISEKLLEGSKFYFY